MNSEVNLTEEKVAGGKCNQILMSIILCLPILAYGTTMGWMSPNKALLMSEDSPSSEPFTEEDISWMASILFIFAPIAVFLYGMAADKYGRKKTLMMSSLPIALGWTVKLIHTSPASLITARALIGFGCGGAFMVCPIYIKEISEDSIRGMNGTFVIFSLTVGNLLSYILGDLLSYRLVLWILLTVPLLHILLLIGLPEAPSYLIKNDRKEEALKVIGWLRSLPGDDKRVIEELDKLTLEQDSSVPKFSPKLLYADKTAMKAFWVTLLVNLIREFCGCIAVLVYASHIFSVASQDPDTSLSLSPNRQSILLAVVQITGSFVACVLVDRAGRKPLLLITSAVSGVSMGALGLWFCLVSRGTVLPGWVPIVALCFAIFADASGLQPLPYVIMTEMFNFQLRGTVATLTMAISLGTDFALLKIFAPMTTWLGYGAMFWIFSVICIANMFYLIIFVPETKNRKLEDIYGDLENRRSRKTRL